MVKASTKRKIMTPKKTSKISTKKVKEAVKKVTTVRQKKEKVVDLLEIPTFLRRLIKDVIITGYITDIKGKLLKVGADGNYYDAKTDKKIAKPKLKG